MKLYLIIVMVAMSSNAFAKTKETPSEHDCNEKWYELSAKYADGTGAGYNELLKQWSGLNGVCSGDVVFPTRLATIHYFAGDVKSAKIVLANVTNEHSQYYYLSEILNLLIMVKSNEWADSYEVYSRTVLANAKKIAGKYPKEYEVMAVTGGLMVNFRDYSAAKPVLESALSLNTGHNQMSGLYRNTAVMYANLNQFDGALSFANKAYEEDQSVTADFEFMLAMSRANAGVGQFKEAQNTLRVLSAKYPEAMQDEDFKAAVNFVFAEIKKSEKK